MLNDVEKQLLQDLEAQDPRVERVHEACSEGVLTRVSLKRNRHGEAVFRYHFGQNRVNRGTFQTLTCNESRCPQRQTLRQQWLIHTGRAAPAARPARPAPNSPCALAAEEHIVWANQVFIAREARFPVTLNCTQHAHKPLSITVKGWDVFGPDGYVAGGWASDAPMFATLAQVMAWLQAQHPAAELVPTTPLKQAAP